MLQHETICSHSVATHSHFFICAFRCGSQEGNQAERARRYAATVEPDMAYALNYIQYWVEFNQSLSMDDEAFKEATGIDKEVMMSALVSLAHEVNTKTRDVFEERYGIPFVALSQVSEVGQSEGRTMRQGGRQKALQCIRLKLTNRCSLNGNALGKNHEGSS